MPPALLMPRPQATFDVWPFCSHVPAPLPACLPLQPCVHVHERPGHMITGCVSCLADQDPGFVGAASRVQGSSQHMPGKLLLFQGALCACADTCCQSQNLFTKPVQLRCSSAEGFSRPCGVPCLVLRRAVVWCGVLWLVCIRCSTQLVGCVVCRSSLTVGLPVMLCCVVAWSLGRPSPCT